MGMRHALWSLAICGAWLSGTAGAAPVIYDFEGYIGFGAPQRHLPAEMVAGAKFNGTMTFDPTLTRFDPDCECDRWSPVQSLQLRTAAGEVFGNAQVTESSAGMSGPDFGNLVGINIPTAEQSSPEGAWKGQLILEWSAPGAPQAPGDQSAFDPVLLTPNHWMLSIVTLTTSSPPLVSDRATAHVTALWRRGESQNLYSHAFSSTPPRWANQGGAWSAASGTYQNAANVAFTSSHYGALALRDSFSLSSRLFSGWDASGNTLGLLFNRRDSANYYELRFNPLGTATLNKVANGVRAMLDTAAHPGAPKTWFNVNVQRSADRIRVSTGSTQLFDLVDAQHHGGHAGVFASWNKARFDNFRVSQGTAWNPVVSRFESSASGWTPASGTWTVQNGYYRSDANQSSSISLSNPFTTNDYSLDAQILVEWPRSGNRGGLVYDYQDAQNYRGLRFNVQVQESEGFLEVFEIRNGVRTRVDLGLFGHPEKAFGGINVTRVGNVTRITPRGDTAMVLHQPAVSGPRRVGLLASWSPVRFDEVVLATAAEN